MLKNKEVIVPQTFNYCSIVQRLQDVPFNTP